MRKICVVITARPSYSRIKTALKFLKKSDNVQLQIITTSSANVDKYGNAYKVIMGDGFKVDRQIHNSMEIDGLMSMPKSTGLAIIELATAFDYMKPDLVVTIADRFETVATSISASYMNIPLAHIQGGEITGNIDEKVRHVNTKFADIHLVSTKVARENLIKMGEHADNIHITGCPSIDIAKSALNDKPLNQDVVSNFGGVGRDFSIHKEFCILLQHPVTNEFQDSRNQITNSLTALKRQKIQTLVFWPNADGGTAGISEGIRAFREQHKNIPFHYYKNVSPENFIKLLKKAKYIIGNSSVGIRECSYLGTWCINIGTRQKGRERGSNVIQCGNSIIEIEEAVNSPLLSTECPKSTIYGDGNAGQKIGRILETCKLSTEKLLCL